MKKSISKLKKDLDKIYSEYIRSKDANFRGNVRCYTCGKIFHWKQVDCGHYESRSHNNTRYDERNTKPQCKSCNIWKRGNLTIFAVKLQKEYGTGILEELRKKASRTKQFTIKELEKSIECYKDKLKEL